ncbi:MAG: methyltransferase domain-containing protein [Cyanobacteriota bacterium]
MREVQLVDNFLSEEQIQECQAKFNLTYHVPYASVCQRMLGFKGKDVLEVGGSLPEQFVFEYLHVNSWSAIETPDYAESLREVGGITHLGTRLSEVNDISEYSYQQNSDSRYKLYLENIEDLPVFLYEKYDLIFSIAAFEHISKFPAALRKMYYALKPGGKLFSMFSPIWSAFNGHHLPEIVDKSGSRFEFNRSPIPPWGHLLMRPAQMCQYLYQHTDEETADLMVYYIYQSPHINRLFTEDYVQFFNQSRFAIERLELTFPVNPDSETQAQLENAFPGRKWFGNNGILVCLSKS